MSLTVAAIGRLRDSGMRSLLDDYAKRIRRYTPFEEHEVKDDAQLLKQWRTVQGKVKVVALEVRGQVWSSTEFSRRLARWQSSGKGGVVFFIGGAEGLPSMLVQGADVCMSLSSLTLPHRLARLVLFEQVYRALSLARGEPYARED